MLISFILFLNVYMSGFGSMTVTTRVGYAIARDKGFPGSSYLAKISPKTKNPNNMLLLIFLVQSSLCILPLFSEKAFTVITGITTVSYQISYAIPIWLRITSSRKSFTPSYFNLGRYSLLIGWIAAIWLTVTSTIMFLPNSYDPVKGITFDNFNYTFLVISGTGLVASVYWNLPAPYGARYSFN